MIECVYVTGGMTVKGQDRSTQRKKWPSYILSNKITTWTGMGLNPAALMICLNYCPSICK